MFFQGFFGSCPLGEVKMRGKTMRWLLATVMGVSCAGVWADEGALPQLDLDLPSGVYRCEEGRKQLGVERVRYDSDQVVVRWEGKRYTLARDVSFSGLPRYEDRQNGLLWVDLPWKSVLLNTKTERPMAADCVYAQGVDPSVLDAPVKVADAKPKKKAVARSSKPEPQKTASAAAASSN